MCCAARVAEGPGAVRGAVCHVPAGAGNDRRVGPDTKRSCRVLSFCFGFVFSWRRESPVVNAVRGRRALACL